jgi:hypothetical protein
VRGGRSQASKFVSRDHASQSWPGPPFADHPITVAHKFFHSAIPSRHDVTILVAMLLLPGQNDPVPTFLAASSDRRDSTKLDSLTLSVFPQVAYFLNFPDFLRRGTLCF